MNPVAVVALVVAALAALDLAAARWGVDSRPRGTTWTWW